MKVLSNLVSFVKSEPKKTLIRCSVGVMIITFSTGVSITLARAEKDRLTKNADWQKKAEENLLDLSKETGATQKHPGMKIFEDGSIVVITVDKDGQVHGTRHF